MEFSLFASNVLKHELWRTEQRGTTTVGYLLFLVAIVCLIAGVERVLAYKKATRARNCAQNDKLRVSSANRLVATAMYRDSSNVERRTEATIGHPMPRQFVLSMRESADGVTHQWEKMFASVESLSTYLETQTILRIGDFKDQGTLF